MKKIYLMMGLALSLATSSYAQKILFDNTHGETAGNADWVIDADQLNLGIGSSGAYCCTGGFESNAQRIPTPLQSTVTSSTAEGYWRGGISAWGIECVKKGYTVESLPWGQTSPLSYGNTANPQDLSYYNVFVVDEPNLLFSAYEKTSILNFVKNGGGLFIIGDHANSDRNGDTWDSPLIWNNLMDTNGVQVNPFGFKFDAQDISGTYSVFGATADTLVNGPYGAVNQVKWTGGNTLTINPTVNPTIKGIAYKSGSGNNNVLVAYGRYGKGKFVVMADSSPSDDGTGDPGDVLYDGWITDANGNHRRLIMNATYWLATRNTTGIEDGVEEGPIVSILPNPVKETLHIKAPVDCSYELYDIEGRRVMDGVVTADESATFNLADLTPGMYIVKLIGKQLNVNKRIVKQ
jgi:hypothetical protein